MLNPEQQAAVSAIEGPVMVLAGPGTGKTEILASRIEEILRRTQLDPYNILCLTFTESGAVAMRARLKQKIGPAAYSVQIQTFHSFCNGVIQENPEAFSETKELESLSELERVQILREILGARPPRSPWVPFENPYFHTKDLSQAISTLKREDISPLHFQKTLEVIETFLKSPEAETIESLAQTNGHQFSVQQAHELTALIQNGPLHFLGENQPDFEEKKLRTAYKNSIKEAYAKLKEHLPKQKALQEIYLAFETALAKRGRYDFEDMILFVVRKFKSDAWVLSRYQERFQYILVDEYQDSNGAQNEILTLLTTHHETPNIFVVGDDKQSIYRFQGASLENILYFYHRFKNELTLVSLKENYRSGQAILDAAHSLMQTQMESAPEAMGMQAVELIAQQETSLVRPELREFHSEEEEHGGLALLVQNLIQEGTAPNQIAILLRENFEAEQIESLLLKMKIPVRLHAGKNLFKDSFILSLINFMHALETPMNDRRLYRALQNSAWGFSEEELLRFMIEHRARRKPLLSALLEDKHFKDWALMLGRMHRLSFEETLSDWFQTMIRESGLRDWVLQSENSIERLNKLQSLHTHIDTWNRQKHDLRLKDLLDDFDLLIEHQIPLYENAFESGAEAVNVMTAHKSKGLEFEAVFIPHLNEGRWSGRSSHNKMVYPPGLIQSKNQNDAETQNADEKRLLYVAMTRAKKRLFLSHASTDAQGRSKSPSRFLAEIESEKLDNLDTQSLSNDAMQLRPKMLFAPTSNPLHSVRDLLVPLVEDFTLSASSLNSYLHCPRRFLYERLIKIPSEDSRSLAFGSAVHSALEAIHNEHRRDEFPGLKFLKEQFDHALEKELMTAENFTRSQAYGHEVLEEFYEHFSPKFHRLVIPEYNFMRERVMVGEIPITGKLDKLELLDESGNEVRVVDYKTGKPETKRDELKPGGDYHRQIVFYQLLCDNARRFPFRMVQGEICFVEPMPDGSFRQERFEVNAEDKARVLTEIRAVYDDITNLRFLDLAPEEGCGECEYCLAALQTVGA